MSGWVHKYAHTNVYVVACSRIRSAEKYDYSRPNNSRFDNVVCGEGEGGENMRLHVRWMCVRVWYRVLSELSCVQFLR